MYREVEKIQNAIMTDGPVEAAFTVYADFENYVSGVYQHKVAQIPRLRLLFCYNLSITLARYIPRLPANLCTPCRAGKLLEVMLSASSAGELTEVCCRFPPPLFLASSYNPTQHMHMIA